MRRWMMLSGIVFLGFALGVIPSGVQADTHRSLFVSSSEGGALFRIDLATAPGSETAIIPAGLATPEGIACGPDARVYISESALFQNGVGRKISRVNQDGTDYTVVLDFASTLELAMSGGPEGPQIKEETTGTSGLMFFNTRASGGFPHTGSWSATRTGENLRQVLLPFAGAGGNAEATDFLISGPFNRNFLTVDSPNGRVLRAEPPFSEPQTGIDFITGLNTPNGLSVNPLTGDVYVAEQFTGLIKIFTDMGGVTPTGTLDASGHAFVRKIDFDEDGNLYVPTGSGPVLKFGPAGGAPSVIGTVSGGNGVAVCKTPGHM